MKKEIYKIIFTISGFLFPVFVYAQTVEGIFERLTSITGRVIEFLWILVFAVFIWGIVKFIAASGNPEKIKTAKNLIIYGLIGVFVLLSFMSIIWILQNTFFDGGGGGSIPVPVPPSISV